MAYLSSKHDIGVTNVGTGGTGTDVIGMMLAKREDGQTPAYEEFDAKFLADQFFNSYASVDNVDPEEEMLLTQNDFRSGFGLEFYDRQDPKRYYSSIGADLRFRGMAIAGPTPTTVTIPAIVNPAAILTNGDMELNANWTNGAQSGAQFHGGTFSWLVSAADAYQDCTVWVVGWQGKVFSVEGWIYKAAGNSDGCIQINDGVTTVSSNTVSAAGAWTRVRATMVLAATATRLRIILKRDTAVSTYFDDVVLSSQAVGTTVAFAEFNDKLYATFGKTLATLNAGGTEFTPVGLFPATITDIWVFGSYLYIAQGTSGIYWYMATTELFTESTAAVTGFQFLCTVNAATPVLWGNDAVNTIRSNTNPINGGAAWSGQTTVDADYNNITDLVSYSGALYIMKEDMPYYLSSAGAVQSDLAPELKSLIASTSGLGTIVWKNALYIPCGAQGLLETDGTTNTFRNPASYCTNLSDFVGRVQALGADEEYLFAVVDNDTKVEILAGRLETIDGSTSWVWHPISEITLAGGQTAYVSSVYQKRLWVASTSASDSLYYIPLPVGYGNITADANRKFKTATYFITPWLHGDFRADTKAWIKLTLTMGHAYNAGRYITAWYQVLGGSLVSIGNFTGSATSMTESKFIDVTNKPQSAMVRFKFIFVTDDTTVTPILNNYQAKAVLYPTPKKLIHCVVNCSEDIVNKQGLTMKNDYDTIKTTLDNARNATWPVTIYDIDGTAQTVKFTPVPRSIQRMLPVKMEKGREQERVYHVLMLVVPLS